MKTRLPVHPYLLIGIFAMGWYRAEAGTAQTWEVILYSLICALPVAAVGWTVNLLVRDKIKTSLMLSALLVVFCFYNEIYSIVFWTAKGLGVMNDNLLAWSVFGGVMLYALMVIVAGFKTKRDLSPLNKLLEVVTVSVLASIILQSMSENMFQNRVHARELQDSAIAPLAAGTADDRPDIYFIIMDSHTSPEQLQRNWNYDESDWVLRVEQRGFMVVTNARSNFAYTPYCILTALDMDYPEPPINLDIREWDPSVSVALNQAKVVQLLHGAGYHIYNFSPFDIDGQRAAYHVQWFHYPSVEGFLSLIRSSILGNPMVSFIWPKPDVDNDLAAQSQKLMQQVENLPPRRKGEAPRFVYLHLMLPHFPYVLDRYGNRRKPAGQDDKSAYLEQLMYTDERVLKTVDSILTRSTSTPVILLRGDHGFRGLQGSERAEEATSIFNAMLLPNGGNADIYPGMTPVNTFRVVMNRYLGAKFNRLKDEIYLPNYTTQL